MSVAGPLAQPGGQEVEPGLVQVIGRLVQQQEVVAGAEQAGEPDPVALPHRHGVQRPVPVGDGAEGLQRDLHPAVGVPGVQRLGRVERLLIGLLVEVRLQGGERGVGGREVAVDDVADGPVVRRHLLLGDAQRAGEADLADVRRQGPGEHVQQGGFAAAVLADHAPAGTGGDGEIEAGQDRLVAAGEMDPGGDELRAAARGHGERHDLPRSSSVKAWSAETTSSPRTPASSRRAGCAQTHHRKK
jgi:hypothetical protein